jgi:Skp family chaperone for outer membrane proteins
MARLAIESRWGGTARPPLKSVNWDAVRASMGKGGHGASSGRGPSHAHHGSGPRGGGSPRGGAGGGGAGRGGAGGEGNEELFASVSPEAFAAASKRINELKTKFKGIVHGIRAATRLSAEAKSRAAKEAEREAAKAREAFAKAEREAAERRATHRREHDAAVAAALEDSHARERREIDALLAEITTGIADLRTDSGGAGAGAGAGARARAGGGSLAVNTVTRHNGSLSNMTTLFGTGPGKRTRRTRRIRK